MKYFFRKKEKPKQINTEVYKTVIRPTLTYGSESWVNINRIKSDSRPVRRDF